jgi:CarD family transcriptional regulator
MLFEVGKTVVCPHHRAATITEGKTRSVKDEEKASTVLDEVLAS